MGWVGQLTDLPWSQSREALADVLYALPASLLAAPTLFFSLARDTRVSLPEIFG